MPCVYISTNVSLDGVDADSIFSDTTKAVARIIGRPKEYVMVIINGSTEISFGGNKEPAAFAEVVSMGGVNSEVKKKLIASVGAILESKLFIPTQRFFLKVHDTTAGRRSISRL